MHGNMMELTVPRSARGPHANREYKLVVVGHRAVGKSALVVRFLTKRFISEYQENSDMTCNGVVEVDGEKLQLNIQDTSENGIRVPSVDHHFRWADAIMLVYSITDKITYHRLRSGIARIKEKLTEHESLDARIPSIVVVGNKGDLDHMRQVPQCEGIQLADELGCRFFESSASDGWSKLITHTSLQEEHSQRPMRKSAVHASERPTTLTLFDRTSRRKSDPTIAVNAISDEKSPRSQSPLNDMNNNMRGNKRVRSPLLNVKGTTVPKISISPSEETRDFNRNAGGSRGRRLMQKLSPRFSRKFGQGNNKQAPPKGLSHIGAGLARVGTAGLAVGHLNQERSMTLPLGFSNSRTSSRLDNLCDGSRRHLTLFDTASSSSSSTESLNTAATFFLRPETPTNAETDGTLASSSDDELSANSDTTVINSLSGTRMASGVRKTLRRSNSICRNLNLHELQQRDRQYNSDSDSSKKTLTVGNVLSERLSSSDHSLGKDSISSRSLSRNRDVLLEKKFSSSEPFKYLCREARTARRMRDRKTPTRFLRDGIRKIRSFATDQGHHNQGPLKQNGYPVAAVRH